MAVTLAELARRFGGRVRGNPDIQVDRVAPLDRAGPRDISFATNRKYLPQLVCTGAGAVILAPDIAEIFSGNALISENPHLCFAQIATLLHPSRAQTPGGDPAAPPTRAAPLAPTHPPAPPP